MAKDLLIGILLFGVIGLGYLLNENRYLRGIENAASEGWDSGYDSGAKDGYRLGVKQCVKSNWRPA